MSIYLLSIGIPLFLGILLVICLWPGAFFRSWKTIVILFIGFGLGLGFSSLLFFLWLLITKQAYPIVYYRAVEFGLCLLLFGLAIWRVRAYRRNDESVSGAAIKLSWEVAILIGFVLLALVFALDAYLNKATLLPHGDWDAWAIWNLHARFVYLGSAQWQDMFTEVLSWSHPDYPLLLPISVARVWSMIGRERLSVPILIAAAFTFTSIGLLGSALWISKGFKQALIAIAVLLFTPDFINHGASQLADVPLGFYNLAACVLILLYSSKYQKKGLLVLAGMTIGLSAWTKNEGWSFVVAISIAVLVVISIHQDWRELSSKWIYILVGLLPVLVIVLYFKFQLAPTNDIISGQNIVDTSQRLLDLNRYKLTIRVFTKTIINFGSWKVSLFTLLAFFGLLIGIRVLPEHRIAVRIIALTIILVLVQYFFIFILTPRDLAWHLTTLNRLFLHIFTSILLLYFLVISNYGEKALDLSSALDTN
jgi:hypothetical protein